MGNLGAREKYGLIVLGIVIAVFIIYVFGIRSAESKYDSLVSERNELQAQLDYYESLKSQNAETQAQIQQIEANISDVEATFLPYIETESIEQYVLKVFEDNGCPYLVSVNTEDITPASVTLPDGTAATDAVIIKRITVQYSTTDGFNIPQYNQSNSVMVNGAADEAAFNEMLEQLKWQGVDSIVGYDEFVAALTEIEAENPDCIKIYSIGADDEAGYILLNASIDFYSATFTDRVSDPDTSAPYITWNGDTNIDTDGGFIGMPFIVENTDSAWLNVMMQDEDAIAGDRAFATYYSNAIFSANVSEFGLAEVLDTEGVVNATGEGEEEVVGDETVEAEG